MEVSKLRALDQAVEDVVQELVNATTCYGSFNSAHEGYAVLLEEVEELWAEVKVKQKRRDIEKMRREAIQVAAMAMRFIMDCTDKEGSGYGK